MTESNASMLQPNEPATATRPRVESANVTLNQKDVTASFENQASKANPSLLREFYDFLRDYSVWWLTPLFVVLLLLAGLVFLGGTAAAPFIYPLF